MPHPPAFETQACEDRDFVEWHRGCPWCAVWVLRVDTPQVQRWVGSARAAMQLWLLPRYQRQPHVTVAFRGLMAGQQAHPHAVFGRDQCLQDVHTLQAAQLRPFAIQMGGVGSFSTVPYIAVAAHAPLQQLHSVLAMQVSDPEWQYVPHVTLGHYGAQLPVQQVIAALQGSGVADEVVELEVDALWLARYRTEDIAGPLHFEGRFDLRTQTFRAEPGALLTV